MEKTKTLGADVVVLDLEDSVASGEKFKVREEYTRALDDGVFSGQRVFVRVSDLETTAEVEEDLRALCRPEIFGFILPKLRHPDQVRQFDGILTKIEQRNSISPQTMKVVPLIEIPEAHVNCFPIALSSKRNICLLIGSGDFSAAAVCQDGSITYDTFFASGLISARAAGIDAVFGVHDKVDDHAGLERLCIKMKRSGYIGCAALTPKQIPIINNAFSFSQRDLKWINGVLGISGTQKVGCNLIQPSVQESRQLIGPPHKELANSMKQRHEVEAKQTTGKESAGGVKKTGIKKGLSSGIKLDEIIQTPTEITITDAWKFLWESAFLNTRGYFNSAQRCKSLGINELPMPFSLLGTMAIALSVSSLSYFARVHLSFKNMFQNKAVFAGDTLRAMFAINDVEQKKGGDGNQYCLTNSTHWMVNQRNEVVFQVNKLTMFSPTHCNLKERSQREAVRQLNPSNSACRRNAMQNADNILLPVISTPYLAPKDLIIHDFVKVLGHSEVRMLCTLLNIVNPHHHNIVRYQATDLLVPGPFVMSAGLGCSALDIGEIVYEEIPHCINPNKVNFGDQVGAITYIESCEPVINNPLLEEVKLTHIALKNMDMEILSEVNIPQRLFESKMLKPSEYESLCAAEIPILLHKIACIIQRKIVRVRPGLVRTSTYPNELILNNC